jgi:hypothetical protein
MCGRPRSAKIDDMLRSLPIALLHVGVLVAPAVLVVLQHT